MDVRTAPRDLGLSPPIALSLAGLGAMRTWAQRAGELGYASVTLDGRDPETRPRQLSRSGVRDIAGVLRRSGLSCAGVELWLPPGHLADPAHADRAVEALGASVRVAAELSALTEGVPVLHCRLGGAPAGTLDTLASLAQSVGGAIADYAWPPAAHDAASPIGVGFDPAAVMLADGAHADLPASVTKHGPRLRSARLSDLSADGRVEPGAGGLDELAYVVALSASGYSGPLVVDLRGLAEQGRVAQDVAVRFVPGAPRAYTRPWDGDHA